MDMMSQLSDDLLIQILSLLPTKDVMVTSCLSKRWKFLWSKVNNLEYYDSNYRRYDVNNYHLFTQFVYRSLLSNKSPVIRCLILTLCTKCRPVDFGVWIDIAVPRHLEELIINIIPPEDENQTIFLGLPSSLYTCKTLYNLNLKNCVRLDVPPDVSLPSLIYLELKDVDYHTSDIPRLLSGCLNLKDLVMTQDKLDAAILVPSLMRLKITNQHGGNEKGVHGLVIDCPLLKFFEFRNSVCYEFYRIEYMPELEIAYIDMMRHGVDHKFLKAFSSARVLYLSLSLSEILPPSDMTFHQLVKFELNTCVHGWWDLLTLMLQVSPNLQLLKLNDVHVLGFPSEETPSSWTCPSPVPKCLLHSLETFVWKAYKGRSGDKVMATYILTNATRLKTATFSPISNNVEARYVMLQDLASVATPSPWFQLFFDRPIRKWRKT